MSATHFSALTCMPGGAHVRSAVSSRLRTVTGGTVALPTSHTRLTPSRKRAWSQTRRRSWSPSPWKTPSLAARYARELLPHLPPPPQSFMRNVGRSSAASRRMAGLRTGCCPLSAVPPPTWGSFSFRGCAVCEDGPGRLERWETPTTLRPGFPPLFVAERHSCSATLHGMGGSTLSRKRSLARARAFPSQFSPQRSRVVVLASASVRPIPHLRS